MKRPVLGISTSVFLFVALGQSAVAAAPTTVTGPTALAVAAVVAQNSPLLSAYQKRTIAALFDGNVKAGDKRKLTISADAITCRISNVAIAERSCELTFKKAKRSLSGREANEVFATLASAGVTAEGAAGSMIEGVTKLSCTLDPAIIKDNSGGGADCSLTTGE